MIPRDPERTMKPEDGYRPGVVAALLREHAAEAKRATLGDRLAASKAGLSRVGARLTASRWAKPAAKALAFGVVLSFLAALGLLAGGRVEIPEASAATSRAAAAATSAPPPAPSASASAGPGQGEAPKEPAAPPKGILDDGRVVLNVATEDELTKLPHVGPKRARDIVALRTKLGGRFKAVTDLLRVKGLGRKTLAKLTPKVVLDPPKD